ncbi:MAG TPA: SAM-dependent methyltransferase [Pseudonocardiaceae bacterium]|nr:SAM-dependent methyltransferase [Pseudonocardiaceae bacterium]
MTDTSDTSDTGGQTPPPGVDTSSSHSARVWNYWLGGKDNYPADHEAGDQFAAILPSIVDVARSSRAFLVRAVQYLAGEAGIRQFLDVGTGLPTANNTHEIAQAVAPECRIVYVDNDPLVLVHARALLTSTPEGMTDYVEADLRDPDTVLRQAAATLDFTQPVALMVMGTIEHVMDTAEAYAIINRLLAPLPSGSYLVLYDPTTDGVHGQEMAEACRVWNESGGTPPVAVRHSSEIARFFDGLEVLEPGVVPVSQWRPDLSHVGAPAEVNTYGGVGRKP